MKPTMILMVSAAFGLAASTAFAQAVPGGVLPGQIERQFREPPQPRSRDGAEAPAPAPLPVPAGAEGVKFTVSRIELEGLGITPSAEFSAALKVPPGGQMTLADLYALADTLTARLRSEGYLLARVLVPPQTVDKGAARLKVIEGHIAEVQINGDEASSARIRAYADKIRASRPLKAAVLERYMLLINDLPGVFASATLAPAQGESGAADLVIQVTRRRWDAAVSADNRGGRILGSERVIASVAAANLVRDGDNTALKAVASPGGELAYVTLQREEPVGSEGGRVGISLSATRAKPEERTFVPLDLETRSHTLGVVYSHPLVRSRRSNVGVRAGLFAHNGEEEVFGVTDREDKLRSLRAGITWDWADALRGANLIDVELSRGLSALGASDNGDPMLTRAGGKVDYTKLVFFAARVQDFSPQWSALVALTGQYAFDSLLASELFGFGGEPFGRGYDPSELVGDHGAAFKAELRRRGELPLAGGIPYGLYAFYDVGQVWQRDAAGGDDSSAAASAGLGIRVELDRRLSVFSELAKPLTRPVAAEGDKNPRWYLGLSARL